MSVTATQKNIYESRVESFIADSESREKVYFAFDQDLNTQPYLLCNSKGRHKTDRNGRTEGELILPRANVDVLLSAQSPSQPDPTPPFSERPKYCCTPFAHKEISIDRL